VIPCEAGLGTFSFPNKKTGTTPEIPLRYALLAPYTHEPRDLPTVWGSEFTTKAATLQGDSA
jgi:hypothetical protein